MDSVILENNIVSQFMNSEWCPDWLRAVLCVLIGWKHYFVFWMAKNSRVCFDWLRRVLSLRCPAFYYGLSHSNLRLTINADNQFYKSSQKGPLLLCDVQMKNVGIILLSCFIFILIRMSIKSLSYYQINISIVISGQKAAKLLAEAGSDS